MASFRRAGTRSQAGGHCHVQARRANLLAKPADETVAPRRTRGVERPRLPQVVAV